MLMRSILFYSTDRVLCLVRPRQLLVLFRHIVSGPRCAYLVLPRIVSINTCADES